MAQRYVSLCTGYGGLDIAGETEGSYRPRRLIHQVRNLHPGWGMSGHCTK